MRWTTPLAHFQRDRNDGLSLRAVVVSVYLLSRFFLQGSASALPGVAGVFLLPGHSLVSYLVVCLAFAAVATL